MCQRCDDKEDEDLENSSDGLVVQVDATWAGTMPVRTGFWMYAPSRPGYGSGHDLLQAVDRVLTSSVGRRGIVTVRVEFEDTKGVFPGQTYQEIATTTEAVTDVSGDAGAVEAVRRRRDGDLFEVQSVIGGSAYSTAGHYEEVDALADPECYLVVHGA